MSTQTSLPMGTATESRKTITVINPGCGDSGQNEAYYVEVQPGHTGAQIMESLGLPGHYVLRNRTGALVDMHGDLFPVVEHGDKMYATPPCCVI